MVNKKQKYTKKETITQFENWIKSIEASYGGTEISTNCLRAEWDELKKNLSL